MKRLLFAAFVASLMLISGRSDAQTTGRVFWKGMVDAKIQLIIKGDKIETKTLGGTPYPDGVYSFTSPLPDEAVKVDLTKTDGRGKAAVIQQPTEQNNYTAIVEVTDDKSGAREYRLEIFWQ